MTTMKEKKKTEFQKDLIVWKLNRQKCDECKHGKVSEGLNSVETPRSWTGSARL